MKVLFHERRPAGAQVSIERVFGWVRDALPEDVQYEVHRCPYFSRGVMPRIGNLVAAKRRDAGAQVNHVTGDVHYLALALFGPRTVLTVHDCAALDRLRGWKRALLKALWFDLPLRRVRVVTAVSEATRRELVRHCGCDPAKIRVIPNCVGPEFQPVPKQFNATEPVILQVGTSPNKNLLRVAAALEGIRCQWRIIGALSPAQRDALKVAKVHYTCTPRLTDAEMVDAYRSADLVVFASTGEGFGLPIIEANATGRPVVTGNNTSLPEVAGDAALLVDSMDVFSIRAAVQQVIRDPALRSRLVAAGFENIRRFHCRDIASRYATVYREIDGQPNPSRTPAACASCK